MNVAVVTDSTAYLSPEQYKQTGIRNVPLAVILEGKAYREEIDLSTEEFFTRVDQMDHLPTSSQPTVGDLLAVYQELADEGYDAIISIHLSKNISGTYQNAASVAESFHPAQVTAYDSKHSSGGQAVLALEAARLAKAGYTVKEIVAQLDVLRDSMRLFFVVDDLKNLVKGGRLSSAAGALGTMLKIKPVLTFVNGKIEVFEKIRTQRKARLRIEELLEAELKEKEYPINASILHTNNEQVAKEWQQDLIRKFPGIAFDILYIGPVIGVHTGQGAIGLVLYKQTH